MNCDDARTAMLEGANAEAVTAHMSGCRDCRAERASIDNMREILVTDGIWEEPSDQLVERLMATIRSPGTVPVHHAARRRRWLAATAATLVATSALFWLDSGRPDWQIRLTPTDLEPAATASVDGWVEAGGTRLRLLVDNLPAAPRGHYYEIWLTAPDGTHVSAGSFAGSGSIEASVGVRRADYPRIWITLEIEDGDGSPSLATYFDTPAAF